MNRRHYRVASLLRQSLAPLVCAAVRDGVVSLRHIDLNGNCGVATVSFALAGGDRKAVEALLQRRAPEWRLLLARRLNLRSTPKLVFCYDEAGDCADKVRDFLDGIAAEPAEPPAGQGGGQ